MNIYIPISEKVRNIWVIFQYTFIPVLFLIVIPIAAFIEGMYR